MWLTGIALLLSLAGAVQAAEQSREIHIVAHDDASNCVADEAPCYADPGYTWRLVSAGSQLEITFENNASTEHALNLAAGANASDEGDTNRSDAFATLGPIEPGETTTATVEVPLGTDTAYLFCHLGDHEAQGLHLDRNVYPAGAVEKGRQSGPGLDDPNDSPASLAVSLIGLAVAGFLLARTRSR